MPSLRVSVLFGTLAAMVISAAVARLTLAQDMPAAAQQSAAPAAPAPNAATPLPPTAATAVQPQTTPAGKELNQAQLDQLVAPVALYPDPVLSQILMASTYPLEIVEADRWLNVPANKSLSGDALTHALKQQNWDPSVMALVPFPRVLQEMSNQVNWTEELGNAFLAQQNDVMSAVQRLRHAAMAAGNLKETPECHCTIQTSGDMISILPADRQTVCIPVFNPQVVYGTWPEPAYPPIVFPMPIGFAYEPGLWIGFEPPLELVAFGPLWGWGSIDWGSDQIRIDNGLYSQVDPSGSTVVGGVWVHDPAHRGGVAYTNSAVQARFGAQQRAALTAVARGGVATGAARAGLAIAVGRGATAAAGRLGAAAAPTGRFGAAHVSAAGTRRGFVSGAAIARGAVALGGAGRRGPGAVRAFGGMPRGGFVGHAAAPQIARGHAAPAHFVAPAAHIGGGAPHGGGGGGGHHR